MVQENKINDIESFETIVEIFKKRAMRKEFPAASYIAYIQFGIITSDS